jgi:hypothetical protein
VEQQTPEVAVAVPPVLAQGSAELWEVWPLVTPLAEALEPQVPVQVLLPAEMQELLAQALRVQEPVSRVRLAPDGSRPQAPWVLASPAGPDPDAVPASQAWLLRVWLQA